MKNTIIIAVLLCALVSCSKTDVTPDKIDFTIDTRINRGGNYSPGLKGVRFKIFDSNKDLYLTDYTDSIGKISLTLNKDQTYFVSAITPTYQYGSDIYYYSKDMHIVSSSSKKNGKSLYIQKDMTITFEEVNVIEGYSYNNTDPTISDPSR